MTFSQPPQCSISATINNQLTNFENFAKQIYIPQIIGNIPSNQPTYSQQTGHYIRLNNLCVFNAYILISNINSLSGSLSFTLPVNSDSSIAYFNSFSIGSIESFNTSATSFYIYSSFGTPNVVALYYKATASSTTLSRAQATDIAGNFSIMYGGSYICE